MTKGSSPKWFGLLFVWLLLAFLAGYFRLLQDLPRPAIQGILFLLTFGVLILFFQSHSFRDWIFGLNLKALILIHLIRFVGIYFLILHGRGELPYDFAVLGGWGDIFTAGLALLICAFSLGGAPPVRAVLIWNLLGLIDILFVVATAARLGLQDPESMRALTVLPLSLLATFLVPIIIATHVMIFVRLKRQGN